MKDIFLSSVSFVLAIFLAVFFCFWDAAWIIPLWNWFLEPILHIPAPNVWALAGLILFITSIVPGRNEYVVKIFIMEDGKWVESSTGFTVSSVIHGLWIGPLAYLVGTFFLWASNSHFLIPG